MPTETDMFNNEIFLDIIIIIFKLILFALG